MPYFRRRFRWGESVLAILDHFSTPEVKALHRYCRDLIRNFCEADLEGEGYAPALIVFEMFEYGFVFTYDGDAEEWVLQVEMLPKFASPDSRRRRPRGGKSHQRSVESGDRPRRPRAQFVAKLSMLYKMLLMSPTLTKFWADTRTPVNITRVIEMVRGTLIPQSRQRSPSHIIKLFKLLAEQQSHEYVDVVELRRVRVNSAVWFPTPLWTFGFGMAPRVSLDGLWDVSLFGALPEQASG